MTFFLFFFGLFCYSICKLAKNESVLKVVEMKAQENKCYL